VTGEPRDPSRRARVVVADDHAAVVKEIVALLEREFEVVRTVGDGRSLVSAVEELKPDAAVVDVFMPVLDGLSAVAEIRRRDPGLAVVFVSVQAVSEQTADVAGARFVSKSSAGEQLLPAVHAALRGGPAGEKP
jgi:DNA-binding NarL/FixJ family response regulator